MIKKQWQNWLTRRFAFEQQKTLAQRDVLVFFNREGYLYLILIVITFIAGINYGNNLVLALCFLLSSILVLSFYLAFKQLYGLMITIDVEELGQVGHELVTKYQLTPKNKQIHLRLRCQSESYAKKITVLKSPLVIEFSTMMTKRGKHQISHLYFYSVYPFGIIRAWSYLFPKKEIWIAPQPKEVNLTRFGLRQHHDQQQQGIEDFSHLREFMQGDALNRIAWQQYAKGRGLLIKEFEENEHQQLNFNYTEMPMSLHEDKLSQLMYLIQQAYDQHFSFALKLPTQTLVLGQGEQHYLKAKLMLAQEP